MNSMHTTWIAQDRINERIAEAQRERLIRAARASSPRPIGFSGATGSFAVNLIQPVKNAIAALGRVVHQPATGLGKTATHA